MPHSLVKAHRFLALGLGFFILSHLAIHLSALAGAETHMALLSKFQGIYRNWAVEPLLYIAIITQVIIGGKLVWRRYSQSQKGFWGWAQIISGAYLAMFMIVHGSAALITRHIIGLDTNFYWAAGTLNIDPIRYLFAPYYMLGVMSVFVHLGAAIHFGWEQHGKRYAFIFPLVGLIVSTLIIITFSGGFYEIVLPTEVVDVFEKYVPG